MLEHVHALATWYHWSEEAILRLPIARRIAYLGMIEAHKDRALFAALDAAG
jgi:hypothetical protein